MIGLVKACAAITADPRRHLRDDGRRWRKEVTWRIYAHLLGRGSVGARVTLWKTQHDSGELTVSAATPDSATYTLSGWDHASREYCRLLGAYFVEVTGSAGAAEPSAVHPRVPGQRRRLLRLDRAAGSRPEATLRAA